ncbi:MAG: xanthine dehydrogenase molybdopterin binding subunit [Bacteroidetes bacterium]|nr:xanthine dehydrogenase molybdopterin binding subunit [Bacteroidota bacterium]MBU1720360.1 xanthine dehydrogenase molybdopterin binding subunit [Bacteroidota bacterium]
MNQPHHDSAIQHVTGESVYINDMDAAQTALIGKVVLSKIAHAKILSFDLEAAKAVPGVHCVLSYKDIPGHNQVGPVIHDEPCLAEGVINFAGQAMFLIAAETEEAAIAAEKLIKVSLKPMKPVLTIEESEKKEMRIAPERKIERGDLKKALKQSDHVLNGEIRTGAQEHWYLETQTALCVPGEGKELNIFSSTQHPSETQIIVCEVIGIPRNEVVVEVRRMGGAFGGKETQANHVAAWAALMTYHTRKPVLIHLFRDDDQIMTGKRHPFLIRYSVGFDKKGKLLAYDVELHANAGAAADLSMAILERGMLHAENAYFIPNIRIIGNAWRTNLVSNTAFRGFGAPQGVAAIEEVMDRVARHLKLNPYEVRAINFYGEKTGKIAPYGAKLNNIRMDIVSSQLLKTADYKKRKKAVLDFNKKNERKKRGIYCTPVKFGISFTTSFLNQAGALVHVYTDGTVLVNHGGTEMGQGLNTKMRQIAALELGVSYDDVKVNATNTSKVPNTSATAASTGSDLNGMAIKNAIVPIKQRLADFAAGLFSEGKKKKSLASDIIFENGIVSDSTDKARSISFAELISKAYFAQISLSSNGFYRTPNIQFDRATGTGKPFHYYTYGMSVTEVELDILSGEHRILRTDILYDAGNSINEAIDKGQIEGAYVQGAGWVTLEEMKWNADGIMLTHSPDTYKIPTINDIPEEFNVQFLKGYPNEGVIRQSKALGEPPFLLALSVWHALKDAVEAAGGNVANWEIPAGKSLVLKAIRG